MVQLLRLGRSVGIFPELLHALRALRNDGEHCFVNSRGVPISHAIAHFAIPGMPRGAEGTRGLDDLVRNLARDLQDDVEEQKRDVAIESILCILF